MSALLRKKGLLVEADFTQCTNCLKARIVHKNACAHSKIAHLFVQDGCENFEVRPFNLMLPGEKVRLVSFQQSQQIRPFIADLEYYGEVEALRLHPEARLELSRELY